jgi:transcriptional regulator with XRE-family HTH domain
MGPSAQELLIVRKRVMGILIRDVRETGGHSIEDVADLLGITPHEYQRFEAGEHTPTLPQLEVMSYYFNVPIKHFWGRATLAESQKERDIKERVPELMLLRQRILGARLRQLREGMNLTQEQVAERANMSVGQIEFIERGMLELPITALERVAEAVNGRLEDLIDSHGSVGNWIQAQDQFKSFADMPPELRKFMVMPINRSYIELAMRLSNMEVDQLRTIAESILQITY